MIKTSLIVILFALAVELGTCTNGDDYFYTAPTPSVRCSENGARAVTFAIREMSNAIKAAKNDSNKQNNLLRELQEQWYFIIWHKIQVEEWVLKPIYVQRTPKIDLDSLMKRFQYTRINVWLDSFEYFFFPKWLSSTGKFNLYEKWLICFSICQEERWKIFKQAINDKYGGSNKERTIALAQAMLDLHSELSSEIPYYYPISFKVPEADREIAELCSVFGEPTTMKHLACKLVIKAQSSLGHSILRNLNIRNEHEGPHSDLYGVIRSKNTSETFKVITERFTNKNSSATATGVENCTMTVEQLTEKTNWVFFFATCPSSVTGEELENKLSPLIKTHVLNVESDLNIFKAD